MRRSNTGGTSIRKGKSSGGLYNQESSRSVSRSVISRKNIINIPTSSTTPSLMEHKKKSIVAISGKNDEESSSSPRAKSFNGRRKSRVALNLLAGEEFESVVSPTASRNPVSYTHLTLPTKRIV
eukprot:TRINITY_DN38573_c0_g1_i1.p1 TRINITY_DN38573_c0_g1~~TRINITY_DN38573_c0_g1_i1.p1  ORF type:complete len:124 (-),score=27.90 TRINITY_DN38573_c0_g1_i1:54-425(-)